MHDHSQESTEEQLIKPTGELAKDVEDARKREEEIARFAEERRKRIAELDLDSHLQRLADLELER